MVFIRVRFEGKVETIPEISKVAPVRTLMKMVHEITGLPVKEQRLLCKGKELDPKYTLYDFGIDRNMLIDVHKRVVLKEEVKKEDVEIKEEENKENDDGNGAKEEEKDGDESAPTESNSAEKPVDLKDIFDGNPEELVLCEDCKNNPQRNGRKCKKCADCRKCLDDKSKDCKECSCNICGKKERDELNLMCDECEFCYHTFCLDPPLETIPEGDWYCPVCKNDKDEVVMPGQLLKMGKSKAKMPSMMNKSSRDWGNGMATTGRSKTCTKVPSNHFGPIPGVDVGMCWKYRIQVSRLSRNNLEFGYPRILVIFPFKFY
jgi:hypothetical protein